MDLEIIIYLISLIGGAIFFIGLAFWIWSWETSRLPWLEKLPRRRFLGGVLGLAALLLCVPHAVAVLGEGWEAMLYVAAVVLAVLSYFFLDFILARALAGLAILLAYYWVHQSFVMHTPLAHLLALFSWILGIGGIVISAKPTWMRTTIRAGASHTAVRFFIALYFALFGILLGLCGIWQWLLLQR